jgi:hypothetical protein
MIPEWLIDDTAEIGEARVFCTHTRMPMFVGELLPDDEAPIVGSTFAAPHGQTLCNIVWFDQPSFSDEEAQDMCRSLAEAVKTHDAVRSHGASPADK